MEEQNESFLTFWNKMLRCSAMATLVVFIIIYSFGGSVFMICLLALVFPLSLFVTIPFVAYSYYWLYGNEGKKYDAFFDRIEGWVDRAEAQG